VIHTAAPLDDVQDSVAALMTGLVVAIPLVVLALGVLVWCLVGRTLRPVEAITEQVGEITGTNLHRRVPSPGTNDEIASLVATMNAMLDRLEASAERQRRFVDDASHELRSPLTRMHAELEVDLEHPDTADPTRTRQSGLDEVIRLEHLVRDLLELARMDSGTVAPPREPVDLDDLAMLEAARLRATTRLSVNTTNVSGAQVLGDRSQLSRALRNLADNAVRHARSTVTFSTNEFGESAELSVADDGPGIPEEQRSQVFERFTRLDDARNAGSGGTGLGLAITRDIVRNHGGTVRVEGAPGGGARFVVTVPLAAPGGDGRTVAARAPEQWHRSISGAS
jgi:signal transduction histidine kinase